MKIKVLTLVFVIAILNLNAQNKKHSYPKKKRSTVNILMKKMNLSLAVKGEPLKTVGNVFIWGWNSFITDYEKDENGDRIKENGQYVKNGEGLEADYIKNNTGFDFKLDYYLTPSIVISGGLNYTEYDKSFFGEDINNNGYFFETQLKPNLNSDFYFFGQVGRTKSIFSQNEEVIKHAQYATGFGLGNDYYGLDIGANFFRTPNKMRQKLLENTTIANVQKSYLESLRVMLRLTVKLF